MDLQRTKIALPPLLEGIHSGLSWPREQDDFSAAAALVKSPHQPADDDRQFWLPCGLGSEVFWAQLSVLGLCMSQQ